MKPSLADIAFLDSAPRDLLLAMDAVGMVFAARRAGPAQRR
jgi:hypothetical protein